MKFKQFQRQDLARAALHDGLILSWDTGTGKSIGALAWPLLKVGHEPFRQRPCIAYHPLTNGSDPNPKLNPSKPVLLIMPGDLHQQFADEACDKFGIRLIPLSSQDDFMRLTGHTSLVTRQLPTGFFVTSYSQLTTNNVARIPDAMDCDDPVALMQLWGIKHGSHVAIDDDGRCGSHWDEDRPDFETTCHFFAWRGIRWADDYHRLGADPKDDAKALNKAYDRSIAAADRIKDPVFKGEEIARINESFAVLKQLVCNRTDPHFNWLAPTQQEFVTRHFLHDKFSRCEESVGEQRVFHKDTEDKWQLHSFRKSGGEWEHGQDKTIPAQQLKIECIYTPSLADLCYEAFECVCVDEGVRMKGEDTYVGMGVRKMNPKYRCVLTASPIKNRLPDIFRLAYWATGGNADATARWPYRDDSEERQKFAETFMVSERNVTKEEKSERKGGSARYKRLTAEVCNIHRLWKLLGPIVLRRRKDECGEDIVPKVRHVIRCEMGTLQQKVYQYHLEASYTDKNGDKAVGAQLQALRMAAASPDSDHLLTKPGDLTEPCHCTQKPVPMDERLKQLQAAKVDLLKQIETEKKSGKDWEELVNRHTAIEKEIANPVTRFTHIAPRKNCVQCNGEGSIPLPHRSGQAYVPKMAATLQLVHEILEHKEQVVVFSAFNDPLDNLSRWLTEAEVRHVKLDGRTSQKARGKHAASFKRGRNGHSLSALRVGEQRGEGQGEVSGIPVMLAGVECMAEGHSFHLANNVILIAYSWAYDKFIQAINRVHRMTSEKPVNVYVIVCTGTIDLRLENLIQDKGDAAELVLDGRLIGERTEEINLAELLKIAHREFDARNNTVDEAIIQSQWPQLRDQLRQSAKAWHPEATQPPQHSLSPSASEADGERDGVRCIPLSSIQVNNYTPEIKIKRMRNKPLKIEPLQPAVGAPVKAPALDQSTRTEILHAKPVTMATGSLPVPEWKARLFARVAKIQSTMKADL